MEEFDLSNSSQPRLGYESAAIAAFVLVSLTIISRIDIGVAVAAAIVLIGSRLVGSWGPNLATRAQHTALAVAGFLMILGVSAEFGGWAITLTTLLVAPAAVAVGFLSLWGNIGPGPMRWVGPGLLVAIVLAVGAIWILVVPMPEIDVLDLHVSAAEVLAAGGNPYAEARVPDTNSGAPPGVEIVGYPYPPLTMIPYVGAQLLLGDPRWASVIAIALTVMLIVRPREAIPRSPMAALLAVGLAVAVQPVFGHIVRHGWTEPLALPLLAGVGLLWRKNSTLAAVLLGLTFGLKQYWIVALPLLFFWSDDYRWKRFWIAGGVAALSLLPAFLVGPTAAWNAMVVNLMDVAPRPDSIGFAGLGWEVPFWLALALSAAVAVWMGSRGGGAPRFLIALAATLATAFLFGTQAFGNYWFLVGTLGMVAVAIDISSTRDELAAAAGRPTTALDAPPG